MEFAENAHTELIRMDADIFDKSNLVYYDKLLQKTSLELRSILGEDLEDKIKVLEQWFLDKINPINLKDFETNYDNEYEETCFLLGKHTNKDPKKLTVKEFYTIIIHLKKPKK